MGDLFAGTTKTTEKSTSETGPSKFQLPYLTQGFDAARDDLNKRLGTPYYQGGTYAANSTGQNGNLDQLRAFAGGQGMSTANNISQIGQELSQGSAQRAQDTLGQYVSRANEDPTGQYLRTANEYANSPYITGQIDQVGRDITRNFNENTLPGIDRNASAYGNINSSRTGIASGIAQRGAQDTFARTATDMRSGAFDRGLSAAQADRQASMNALRGAAGDYAGYAGQGINAMSQGITQGLGAYGAVNQAYGVNQADQQGTLDEAFKRWQGGDNRTSDILNQYLQSVGSNQWGSSGTATSEGTSRESGNIMKTIASIAASAASAAGGG
jgi:hypothetical protein